MTAIDDLFTDEVKMLHGEAVELTLASLRAYWPRHQHVAVAWSGGKDSTATLTLLIHLIAARTFPDKWSGDEPRADTWLDAVLPSGAVQPILFRDMVGS